MRMRKAHGHDADVVPVPACLSLQTLTICLPLTAGAFERVRDGEKHLLEYVEGEARDLAPEAFARLMNEVFRKVDGMVSRRCAAEVQWCSGAGSSDSALHHAAWLEPACFAGSAVLQPAALQPLRQPS